MSGWFDNYKNEIVRNDKDGVISYNSIEITNISNDWTNGSDYQSKTTTHIDTTEVYLKALEQSKKKLSPELKQVIDDFTINELNEVTGLTHYVSKTPLGHAIDAMNVEAVQYLLELGADTSIRGQNQQHILQELLASNATEKRIQILELVLKHYVGNIPVITNYNGQYYSDKYLVILINFNVVSKKDLLHMYDELKPAQKKKLIQQCDSLMDIVMEKGDEAFYPDEVKDIFLF